MNDLCCGAPNGQCTRHGMAKGPVLVQLCNGTSPGNCSALYWNAWENGRCGAAVRQDSPQLDPPGFCTAGASRGGEPVPCSGCGTNISKPGLVTMALTAASAYTRFVADGCKETSEAGQAERHSICSTCPLNDAGQCSGCGCYLSAKIPMRLEACPAGKWFPELHTVRPLNDPVRNLIYHILPVAKNNIWKWNLQQLALRWNLFNGRRCLSVNFDQRSVADGRVVATVSPDEVIDYCRSLGMEWSDIRAVQNGSLGEVIGFGWLLDRVQSTEPNTVTFYAHAKGVTREGNTVVRRWTDWQYRACLDDWPATRRALEGYSMAGAFRSFGEFKLPGNHQWHYSGTFFWFRHDDVFSQPSWGTVDQINFGVEAWPGRMFRPEKTACLFSDDARDLYLQAQWDTMERACQVYEGARL